MQAVVLRHFPRIARPNFSSLSLQGKRRVQLVLLDHGLYREMDEEFRVNYCAMWKVCMQRILRVPEAWMWRVMTVTKWVSWQPEAGGLLRVAVVVSCEELWRLC